MDHAFRTSAVLDVRDAIARVPMDGLERLAAEGERVLFAAGAELVRQGEPSDAMYLLVSGSVRVERAHLDLREALVLAILGPGDVVGEMGLLDGMPRSATVIAIDDVVATRITAQRFGELIVSAPALYGGLVRVMSLRLRSTDELATELAAKRSRETT